ncbi:GNAT family N-acetyltransferase [Pedobacter sp. HMF7647]|uniref:GNAT family N-acetyltransferase n=1 Tax=Hufsiella arboris TaxID=2695275 RepID=A0A7K1Y9B3_9SPHI|nr:GNAT family N-acetyltransferase [Hufsiella arboris]MXV50951.1 GNAT family N-acetyltransferase [Hufsiella arboris]
MNIRNANPGDLDEILDIMNEAILHSTAIYDYDIKDKRFIESWFEGKQSEGYPVLVYERDGCVVAYCSYGIFRPKIGYQFSAEHSVYVHKDFHGNGIGKQLLTALIVEARNQNYHTMIAGIDAENKASIVFHEKFGFTEVGRIKEVGYKFEKWLDVVFMQLML